MRGVYSKTWFLILVLAGLAASQARLLAQNFNVITVPGTTWRYYVDPLGTDPTATGLDATLADPSTAWYSVGYDDSTWASGKGLFGIETDANQYLPNIFRTVIPNPGATPSGPITTYFRTHFQWNNDPAGVIITATNALDDGAVFFLNGVEQVARVRVPASQTYQTLGQNPPVEGAPDIVTFSADNLVMGDNVMAVELHQSGTGSSDDVFGMSLLLTIPFPPVIVDTTQPTNRTVLQHRNTTLLCKADGSAPLAFQWFHDGSAMDPTLNATAVTTTLVITNATQVDAGEYFCEASNDLGTADTRTAIVTINLDDVAPKVVRVIGSADLMHVVIEYDEPVDVTTGTNRANYGLTPVLAIGPDGIVVDGKSVILPTALQAPNANYTLAISRVQDLSGNTIVANTRKAFKSWQTNNCGMLSFEAYFGLGGNAVATLTNAPNFPSAPDEVYSLTAFDSRLAYPDNSHEGYGGRIRGLFIPNVSGNWVLYLRSDDASQLWFNSSGPNPAGRALIASESGCCAAFQPVGNPRTSTPIPLIGGQAYYIEALYKEGTGGDYCNVAARLEGEAVPPDTESISGALLGSPAALANVVGPVGIASQPPPTTNVVENAAFTLSVGATNGQGAVICYQWQLNGGDILGATKSSITKFADLSDEGAKYKCRVSVVGSSVVSAETTVHVLPDTFNPHVLGARPTRDLGHIVVSFDERMDAATAGQPFTYTVSGGFTVVAATLSPNEKQVTLTLDLALPVGGSVDVTVTDATDLVGNGVTTTVTARMFELACGYANKELYLNIAVPVAPGTVADVRNSAKYPNNPDQTFFVTTTESPQSVPNMDFFGTRISGFLKPPVSGTYRFFISSDNNGELRVSLTDSPLDLVTIATEPTSNPLRDWITGTRTPRPGCAVGACENQSGDIELTAGQLYYFEALNLDINAGSGDNLSFTWEIPGGPAIANGAPPIDAQYLVGLADPVSEAAYLCAAAACPSIHASLVGTTLTLSWASAPGCRLQVNSTDVGNKTAWSDVAGGATSPVNVTVGAGKKFFRLKKD